MDTYVTETICFKQPLTMGKSTVNEFRKMSINNALRSSVSSLLSKYMDVDSSEKKRKNFLNNSRRTNSKNGSYYVQSPGLKSKKSLSKKESIPSLNKVAAKEASKEKLGIPMPLKQAFDPETLKKERQDVV